MPARENIERNINFRGSLTWSDIVHMLLIFGKLAVAGTLTEHSSGLADYRRGYGRGIRAARLPHRRNAPFLVALSSATHPCRDPTAVPFRPYYADKPRMAIRATRTKKKPPLPYMDESLL